MEVIAQGSDASCSRDHFPTQIRTSNSFLIKTTAGWVIRWENATMMVKKCVE